jgi:hypothetical protein
MPGLMPKSFGKVKECIIIMLGDKNLETLKGYKAEVTKDLSVLPDICQKHHASISITITGLSNKAANDLFDSLVMLPPEELTELIKSKGFNFNLALNKPKETNQEKQP